MVTYDIIGSGASNSWNTTISWLHTVGTSSSDRYLIVIAMGTGNGVPSSVTYNSVSMSLIGNINQSTNHTTAVYGLANPATGSHTVTITYGSNRALAGQSISYYGVDQDTPTAGVQTYQGYPSVGQYKTVTVSSSTNDIVFIAATQDHNTNPTDGGDQTRRISHTGPSGYYVVASEKAGASSVTLGYTVNVTTSLTEVGFSLRAVDAVYPQYAPVDGISSAEAFGDLTRSGGVTPTFVYASGLISSEVFGAPQLNLTIYPSGLFVPANSPDDTDVTLLVTASGIFSSENFGSPTISGMSGGTKQYLLHGKADIKATSSDIITGIARITQTKIKAQTGAARVTNTATKTIVGKSSVRTTSSKIQLGMARIQTSGQQVQTGTAHLHIEPGYQTLRALARIQTPVEQNIVGKAAISTTTSKVLSSKARIQKTVVGQQIGLSRIQVRKNQIHTGVANIQASVIRAQYGKAYIQPSYWQKQFGKANIQATTTKAISAKATLLGIVKKRYKESKPSFLQIIRKKVDSFPTF